MKTDVFSYLDYRSFLKDAFEERKAGSPGLSFRSFAKKAGFSTPNFLQMVIQGKRNLGSAHRVKAAIAFKLNRQETDFFQNLVAYAQAKDHDEKDLFYQKILRNVRYSSTKTLDKSQYEFFSHWYIPVVRELLTHPAFTGEDSWIADRIFPRITSVQVGNARSLLVKLGLVGIDPDTGKWFFTAPSIQTDSEVAHLAARNYHMAVIQMAHDAIKNFPPEARDIRSVTIGIPESAYSELKSRIENTWKDVLSFASQYKQAEAVYQLNLQFFPLTREKKSPNVHP
jgi:uncharacterized protein (TIGR02147 family)